MKDLSNSQLVDELQNRGFVVLMYHHNMVNAIAKELNEERIEYGDDLLEIDKISIDADYILEEVLDAKMSSLDLILEEKIREFIEENY